MKTQAELKALKDNWQNRIKSLEERLYSLENKG